MIATALSPCYSTVISHPYYVSVFNVDFDSSSHTLQITCKIFTDDLEQALQQDSAGLVRLGTERESAEAKSLVANYLKENFKIHLAGDCSEMVFIGKEHEDDMTYCYMEISDVKDMNSARFEVSNLTELYDNQMNIVHLKSGGVTKTLMLSRANPAGVITFP